MDFLRSCYTSKWQLFRNAPVQTGGRFVFARPGALHAPIPHNFGSAVWITDDGLGQLGEQPGVRSTYSKGSVPFPIPRAELLGPGDEVTNGGFYPHVPIVRTLPYGFDSRLWTDAGLVPPDYPPSGLSTSGILSDGTAQTLFAISVSGKCGILLGGITNNRLKINITAKVGILLDGSAPHTP